MAHLVDTSVLARLANTADPLNPAAERAVLELHRRGELGHHPLRQMAFKIVETCVFLGKFGTVRQFQLAGRGGPDCMKCLRSALSWPSANCMTWRNGATDY